MTTQDTAVEPASGRPATALAWSLGNTLAAKVGTLAIGVVIARLLGPEQFGTYAVAYVALLAVLSFNELGVSLAIVRWPEDPRAIAGTVMVISLASSGVLAVLMVLGAPVFTSLMGDPGATPLVRLLALAVLVNGAVAVPAALLQRYFRQGRRTLADQVNVWLGAVVSLGLVLLGVGPASLVLGRLAGSLGSAVVLVRHLPVRFSLRVDPDNLRPLLAFGLPLAAASIVVFAVGFVDQVVVGALLGPVALGYYVLAFNLASWPVHLLSQPLRMVAPALFARMQHDPALMSRSFGQVLRPLLAVAVPGCLALAAVAPDVVRLVYGEAWAPAGVVLRWLAVAAVVRIVGELCYDYLVVRSRSRLIMLTQVAWLVALVPALTLGVRLDGLRGAAVSQVVVGLLVVLPLYGWGLHQDGVRARVVLAPVLTLAPAGALVGAAVAVSSLGTVGQLAVSTVVSLSAVAAALWWVRADLQVWRPHVRT